MHHQRRRQILVRWFGVRRWVVAATRESWTTDRRNGNNDTTKSKCNNSYKGNMHQCGGSSRNGTCSKFRISGVTLFWTSLDRFRSLQQKGTGTQRIRVGGWMSVCACDVGAVGRDYCCIHPCCCCGCAGGGPRLTLRAASLPSGGKA